MRKQRFLLLALLALLLVGASVFGWRAWPERGPSARTTAQSKEIQQLFKEGTKMAPADALARVEKLLAEREQMSEQEKKDLGKEFGREMLKMGLAKVDEYQKLTSREDKDKWLDAEIDQQEAMRQQFEAVRALGGLAGLFGGGSGRRADAKAASDSDKTGAEKKTEPPFPSADSEDRKLQMKKWFETIPAEQRAMMDQVRYDMSKRREARGLPAPSGPWGR
jgi:hypothetical protein